MDLGRHYRHDRAGRRSAWSSRTPASTHPSVPGCAPRIAGHRPESTAALTQHGQSHTALAGVNRLEEQQDALHEERRGGFVVVRQAAVGEEMAIAGVEEQLCA